MPEDREERLMTIAEVTDCLKVSRQSLHRWKEKGILVPVKLGDLVRYRKSDVDRIMREGTG